MSSHPQESSIQMHTMNQRQLKKKTTNKTHGRVKWMDLADMVLRKGRQTQKAQGSKQAFC